MFRYKRLLFIGMLVLMICCVTAVSATDINGTDDTVITDEIALDEVSDVIDDVEIEEADDGLDECECSCVGANSITIDNNNYTSYFYNGTTTTNYNLTFVGNFDAKSFGNFKINSPIVVNACGATFTNVGFDLKVSHITLCGGTFIWNTTPDGVTSVISAQADHATVKCVTMNVTAPENKTFYAIDVENSDSKLINNNIYYLCNYSNVDFYNYIVRVNGGTNLTMVRNTITGTLPMKTVVYEGLSGMDRDFVAGVGMAHSHDINFTNNTIDLTANDRLGGYPTLDAFIIYDSHRANIEKNIITVKDPVSQNGDNSYIYGIDVFWCDNVTVKNNTVTMNADKSGGYIENNATGAAYCVQFTGPYKGAVVSNNILTTRNNGPNAAIYSQNWGGPTNITITNNTINVTGKGSDITWELLTGIELQDDYATVTGNTITVTNRDLYLDGYNVYGISYCQYSPRDHTYIILNNTVTVNEGFYTVYIMNGNNCNVTGNTLNSIYWAVPYQGNTTVYVAGDNNYIGPNP